MAQFEKPVTIKLGRVLQRPDVPPKRATQFYWNQLGEEIQFDLAYTDLLPLRETAAALNEANRAGKRVDPEPIPCIVFERISLSTSSALELARASRMLVKSLKDQGLLGTDRFDEISKLFNL